jgi:hypothetical protein
VSYSAKEKFKKTDQQTKDEMLSLLMQDRHIQGQKDNVVTTYSLTPAVNKVVMFSVLIQHTVDFPLFVDLADNHIGRDEQ